MTKDHKSEGGPWSRPMTEETFGLMRDILGAPSPVGYEGAMTFGVVEPYFEKIKLAGWKCVKFVGNASIVLDSDPDATDVLTVTEVNGDPAGVGTTVTLPSGAELTVNPDGTYEYNPNGAFDALAAGESTTETFTYTIDDGNGGTDTASVDITVQGPTKAQPQPTAIRPPTKTPRSPATQSPKTLATASTAIRTPPTSSPSLKSMAN